ncbi:MAG: SRPBCC domain-containing protein [Mariniphaga sp.]|nr:SRPBCC domain-containing protein [Mariniphaga sp.]
MNSQPITIEKSFSVPLLKVWKAVTDPKEMKKWYFDIPDFTLEIDFKFSFEGGTDKREYIHLCKITEVNEYKKLSYSWKYKGIQGETNVSFELEDEGNSTTLKLTHSGLESFPANNPDLSWNSFYEGWSYLIGTSLKDYLGKN